MVVELVVPVVEPESEPQPGEQDFPFWESCQVTNWLPVPPVTVSVNICVAVTGTFA